MTYPNLLRRYLASIIDMLTVSLFIYLYVKSPLYSPGGVGVLVALILLLSFEPLMTVFLCTPGQALMRFRVRHAESFTRISLGSAYLRVLTKYALGMITFFTLPLRRDRRAIHDLAAESIVVEASAAK